MVAAPIRINSLRYAPPSPAPRGRFVAARVRASEKLGVRLERNPAESRLSELGVRQWPKWGCEKSKFPWTYSAKETCYLLQGKVKVYPRVVRPNRSKIPGTVLPEATGGA